MGKLLPAIIADETKERFWAKVDVRAPDECWEWQGSRNRRGYGRFWCGTHACNAHRFALATTQVVPPALVVDHLCRNTRCVNPGHLEAVIRQSERVGGDARRR